MGELNLTPQQREVVENRGGSLLVSAAAGSGKTRVLVERLFRYVTEEHCNIDADPCCHSEDDSYCQYCDWAGACHFQDGRDGDHLHYILPVKAEEFWKSLEEES